MIGVRMYLPHKINNEFEREYFAQGALEQK